MAQHGSGVKLLGVLGCLWMMSCSHQSPEPLPTGKSITPNTSIAPVPADSWPINIARTPDGKFAVTTGAGHHESLWSIRMEDSQPVSHIEFTRSLQGERKTMGLYYGLAFLNNRHLFAAQGAADKVAIIRITAEGTLEEENSIDCRKGDFPAGLAVDAKHHLYVANNDPAAIVPPFDVPGSIAIYDIRDITKAADAVHKYPEIGRYEFRTAMGATTNFPLALAVLSDGSKLYVASQRDACVYVLDTTNPKDIKLKETLQTGAHPDALLLDKSQKRLFVANASSDTVSVVDTAEDRITSTILLRPEIARHVTGVTPTDLALSPDEKWLYVTLGDLDAVAVIDIKDAELESYIPAGWYPSGVAVSADGKKLLISNAKGTAVRNPNPGWEPASNHSKRRDYVLERMSGNVITVNVPEKARFRELTEQVLKNNRIQLEPPKEAGMVSSLGVQSGKIKHVIYVVKENRTYDQVLGDMRQGNGDPNLTIFGRNVTPNQHALAERFVLLDNFYDCGEVSGDGWTWSTQAMANEYVIRNVPYQYSNRGRKFDYEGQNNGYPTGGLPAKDLDGKPISEDPKVAQGLPAIPDVSESAGGYIWDLVRKHGLSYRNYGFFMTGEVLKNNKVVIPDNWPASAGLQPGGRDLDGISDIDFKRFDMDYPDSDAPHMLHEQTGQIEYLYKKKEFGKSRAPSRFSEWNREFQMMLKKDPTGGAVPNFMTIRFCTDHTAGLNPLKHAPRSMVADNDYAVGQLVEAVSKSPIWEHCAIFVIEDDAQGGPDHVDAHRSTCFVISPHIKKNSIDHTFHNTASVLRTMELLLGVPPMCQYDAFSKPIMNWTDRPENSEPYQAILPSRELFAELNGKLNTANPVSPEARLMKESMEMDFEHADAAPADRLTDIIWKSVKGWDSEMPKSPGGPFAAPRPKDDDD